MMAIKAVLTDGNEVLGEKMVASLYEIDELNQEAQSATDGNLHWSVAKSPVKYVALNRAEGPIHECKAVVYHVGEKPQVDGDHYVGAECVQVQDIYGAVVRQFINWGVSAPERGYDKCDFFVGWENGKTYEGRFDMQKGGVDGHESFWASLKSRLEFYSLRRRPVHFKDATWQHLCKQNRENGWDKECAEFLDECALI